MLQRGLAGGFPIDSGRVDVAHAVVFVADIAFFFEDAQLRADGRIGLAAGQIVHHLGRRRAAAAEQDIHDLTLSAGEERVERA